MDALPLIWKISFSLVFLWAGLLVVRYNALKGKLEQRLGTRAVLFPRYSTMRSILGRYEAEFGADNLSKSARSISSLFVVVVGLWFLLIVLLAAYRIAVNQSYSIG
jgi:hypothetical protein